MLDVVLKWDSDGKEQVIRDARAVNAEVNKGFDQAQARRMDNWARQQASVAREARRTAFDALSYERKLLALRERRSRLELMAVRAEGNKYRSAAINMRLAQVRGAIGSLEGEISEGVAKVSADRQAAAQREAERRAARLVPINRELQKLARERRRTTFDSLTDAQKLTRLTERRLTLERFITVAEQRGNTYRAQALRLRLAQTNGAIGSLPQATSSPGLLSGILGGAASRAFPFLGGLGGLGGGAALGGPVGALIGTALVVGLGMAARRLTTGLSRAALASIQMADNLGDIADQFRLTRDQVLRLQLGGGFAGVPSRVPMAGLATFENARAQAMGGDPRFRGIFAQFGLGPDDLASDQSSYELAQRVRQSLGSDGARSSDTASLRALFGRRQEGVLASLKAAENAPVVANEGDMRTLERMAGAGEVGKGIWDQIKIKATSLAAKAAGRLLVKALDVRITPGNAPAAPVPRTALDQPTLPVDSKSSPLASLPGRSASDALARIGLFTGANTGLQRRLDVQIAALNRIVAQLATLNREVASE